MTNAEKCGMKQNEYDYWKFRMDEMINDGSIEDEVKGFMKEHKPPAKRAANATKERNK